MNVYGQDRDGRTYSDMLFSGGGQGAWSRGDGKSGLLWPTSAANTSIELFEARAPVLVLEKGYLARLRRRRPTSRRAGQRVRLRKLHDDGMTTLVSVYPEGVKNPIEGLYGGKAGRRGFRPRASTPTASVLRDCGTGELVQLDDDRRDRRAHPRRRLRLSAIRASVRARRSCATSRLAMSRSDGARRDYGFGDDEAAQARAQADLLMA